MTRRGPGPRILAAAASACVLATVFVLAREVRQRPRSVLLALAPEEVQALAGKSGTPLEDLWDRAQTIGAGSVVLREQSLSSLMDRGEVLHFSRSESEKWRAAGLVAPNAPLKANALWIRDAAVYAQVLEAARARRLSVSTQALPGVFVLDLPEELDPKALPIGFDPQMTRLARAKGLIPVYLSADPADLAPAVEEAARARSSSDPVFLLSAEAPPLDAAQDLFAAVGRSRGWLAALDRISRPGWTGLWGALPRKTLVARHAELFGGLGPVWRSVLGRRAGLLIVHLSPSAAVEENLDRLRLLAAALRRDAGLELGLPSPPAEEEPPPGPPGFMRLRYLAALFLAWLTPLASLRQGLQAVRSARADGKWPHASPVREAAQGALATAAAACASGLVIYALLATPEWRLGLFPAKWSLWVHSLPFALGAWALYTLEASRFARRLRRPVTYAGALRLLAGVAFVALLLAPRDLFGALGLAEGPAWTLPRAFEAVFAALSVKAWWLPVRWREVFVGWPCLFVGLWRHERHLGTLAEGRAGRPVEDPRPWLLVGLLGPVGVLQTMGLARTAFWTVLGQTAASVSAGCVLGIVGVGLLAAVKRGVRS